MPAVTLKLGQVVPWPSAPMGFAQVSELRRKKVEICYPFKNGKIARPIVRVSELHQLMLRDREPALPLSNPLGRAVSRPRSKSYEIEE